MPTWLLPLCIVFGLGLYPVFLFLNHRNNPKARTKTERRLLFLASLSFALGLGSFVWAFQISQSMPTTIKDPAFWLAAVLFVFSVLTTHLTSMGLFLTGSNEEYWRMPKRDAFIIGIPPVVLLLSLSVSPLLKIPQNSLVAEDGRILPFGVSYHFVPGCATGKVGINNPVDVSASKPVVSIYYGKTVLRFSAKVRVDLKPGDQVPQDFHWYRFKEALDCWFAERLDNRFATEPRETKSNFLGTAVVSYASEGFVGNSERGTVMGIPIVWEGRYTFRSN